MAASNSLTLQGKNWFYRGEGNVNIVLAVPEDGIVVRVMKDDGGKMCDVTQALWMRAAYCEVVRRTFFNDKYVDLPLPKIMSAEEMCEIGRRIQQDRPPNRTHKGLGPSSLVAVYPDYTTTMWPPLRTGVGGGQVLPVYCAEIKPKQGWLHKADRMTTKCAFCAHQYLKLSRGDVQEISRYCPLDLFSGRRERVERAIHGLLQSPQNNLKIFRDGISLDGDLARAANEALGDGDRFCAFVAAALLGDFFNRDTTVASEHRRPDEDGNTRQPCDFDAVPMAQHCVLHQVLMMQKSQTAGFATVLSAYEQLPSGQREFGHVYQMVQSMNRGSPYTQSLVDGYLIAATAQDCSVYVTFRQDANGNVLFDGCRYAVSVKVSDLDPKPMSTIKKHRKRNADVLLAYEKYSQGQK